MSIKRILSMLAVLAASLTSLTAQAGVTYDAHGNVGYDTAAECDAAVQSGNVKFYESLTHKPPLIRKGEAAVQRATIKDLGEQYAKGACDIGVGRKLGRDGVSTKLQGKFIPYSPDMAVNVYTDKAGNAVRVSMAQCDNWFSGNAPRPVSLVQNTPMAVTPAETFTPVETATTTPVATTTSSGSSPAAFITAAGLGAYAFGTIGAHSEKMEANGNQPSFYNRGVYDDTSTTAAGQVGAGLQFNPYVGGEIFGQAGATKKYQSTTGETQKINHRVIGARAVVGSNADAKLRGFVKLGVAAVHQDDFHPQFTAGLGATYQVTDKVAVRADYDHYFKRSKHIYYDNMGYSKSHYAGVGLQYKFK